MKGNVAIIAALRGELKPLVTHQTARSWKRLDSGKGCEVWEYRHRDGCWLAVCAGMGGARASIAFAEAEKRLGLDAVCSVGWAGALSAAVRAGAVCSVSQVVDTRTGERFRPAHWLQGDNVLVTTDGVADTVEKHRLAASYGATLVDMEAATVARMAEAKGIPFYCLKAVSDGADARLPDLNRFLGHDGQLKMGPFLFHVLLRPNTWRELEKLGRHSRAAATNLAESIYDWLDERGSIRESTGDCP